MVWARLVDEDERVTRSQTYGRRLEKRMPGRPSALWWIATMLVGVSIGSQC